MQTSQQLAAQLVYFPSILDAMQGPIPDVHAPWLSVLQLKTSLQNTEVVVQPPVKETTKLLPSYIKNVAESCR